ncbi:MAG: ABC transporter ATP-binding protein [Oligoflexia bacterium]|nr:ABC transporter ATP-binding protein [Oligoflexia bacterium]
MSNLSPVIEAKNLSKAFGSFYANENISFSIPKGEILGIIGENGAGKSTLMKMLYGQLRPTSGQIHIDGKETSLTSPRDAIARGIGMVHQHFMLAENHSALENIILALGIASFRLMPHKSVRKRLEKLCSEFGISVDLEKPVGELSVGQQQSIEILKLLYLDSNLLIFDEPTAVLSPNEIENFFTILRGLREAGKTIVVISHKLKEILSISDRVIVLRHGKIVAERTTKETNLGELADLMVGAHFERREVIASNLSAATTVFEVKDLSSIESDSRLKKISFRVREGEILGIAGVEGNGQSELIRALMNPIKYRAKGEITFCEKNVSAYSTLELRSLGMSILPENRIKEAVILDWSSRDNFLLGHQNKKEFIKNSWIQEQALGEKALAAYKEYDLRPLSLTHHLSEFSGGNQQKIVVARELWNQPKFIIAAHPTRGVDIGAIERIHLAIQDVKKQKGSVLLISSDLDELFRLSDRLLVICGGLVRGSFTKGEFSEEKVGRLMGGGQT